MARLEDVIAYFCSCYPHKTELSKARLTKMVYLADWRSAIVDRRPVTDIRWVMNHYGPFVDDVWQAALERDDKFSIESDRNMYGNPKEIISLRVPDDEVDFSALSEEDRAILDHVIEHTEKLSWKAFIKLVYSTYPVVVSEYSDIMDLVKLAGVYNETIVGDKPVAA